MSMKDIRKFAILSTGALMTAFGLLSARLSAQELTLIPGATTTVAAGDAACVADQTITNDVPDPTKNRIQGCTDARLFSLLNSNGSFLPNRVDLTTSTRFVKQFHVQAVQGAATTSFLPILIAVPVSWLGFLLNDSAVPALGPLDAPGANVSVSMNLRLSVGTPANPATEGASITQNRFVGTSHSGIAGCLSIPSSATAITAANTLGKCFLALDQRDQGSGTAYLSTIVETGKTYNIELELRLDLFSFNAGFLTSGILGGHPVGNFMQNSVTSAPFGLTWKDAMSITVGTDFQSNFQALQDEITQLRADLNNLRQEFKTHTHIYLTGKGVGQNNTPADTSTPLFPGGGKRVWGAGFPNR